MDNSALSLGAGGDEGWYGQDIVFRFWGEAAQSGAIKDLQETTMVDLAPEDGYVSFWWKVSSEEDYDLLTFSIESEGKAAISGELDWRRVILPVRKWDVLEWKYAKDNAYSGGSDCGWVDRVSIAPCYYSIAPYEVSLSQAAQTAGIQVTAPAGCSWTATSESGWITIIAGSGSGSGTVTYSVAAHGGPARRIGHISIGRRNLCHRPVPPRSRN